jgi:hypothetical protein
LGVKLLVAGNESRVGLLREPGSDESWTQGVAEIPLSVWRYVIGTHADFVSPEAFPYLGELITLITEPIATLTQEIT